MKSQHRLTCLANDIQCEERALLFKPGSDFNVFVLLSASTPLSPVLLSCHYPSLALLVPEVR